MVKYSMLACQVATTDGGGVGHLASILFMVGIQDKYYYRKTNGVGVGGG